METKPGEIFANSVLPDDKLADLPNSAGLVFFTDIENRPIALLTAANIKRAAKTKLAEKIEHNKRADLKSITAKIYYTPCRCKFRLAVKHLETAKKIFGQNYKDHIKLVFPWFIKTDLSENIPAFSVTKRPIFKNTEEILGPFPGQKSATTFLKTLEDTFRLCKRSDLVNNPSKSQSCPYLQMDACVGVCGGRISQPDYLNLIKQAFDSGANPAQAIENFQTQMQSASKELNFEKAARLKKSIEKLAALQKQSYKWTTDLKNLKIVHIDKSFKIKPEGAKKKVQTHAVFVMNFSNIIDLGDFPADNPDLIFEKINAALDSLTISSVNTSDEIIERFSIVSYFLYRSKPSGLWLDASSGIDQQEIIKLK